MKKWNWNSYIAGMLMVALLAGVGGVAGAASTTNRVSFNAVNIGTSTSTIAGKGNGYRLSNGSLVPYSITYTDDTGGGTVYVPLSKFSEYTGTEVSWDGANNKVILDVDASIPYNSYTGTNSGNYKQGYDDGYKAGSSGSSGSYSSGYNDGYDDGYDDGRDSGYYSYNDGYDDGYRAGLSASTNNGSSTSGSYSDGYNAGFAAGEKSGYDKGYAAGEAEGKQEGYQDGYEEGYADGEAGEPENPDIPDKPSEPGGSDVEFDRDSVSEEDLQNYLDTHVPSTVETPLGTYHLNIEVSKNAHRAIPYDFWIKTSHPTSPSWIDFENSLDLDQADVKETISILKQYQLTIYEAAQECAPGAKMQGGYHSSWYKYPSIHEGYENLKVFSWENFEEGLDFENAYEDSKYSGFHWNTATDDYVFD